MKQGVEKKKKLLQNAYTFMLRLSAEMDSLRRVYEEQTEKARNEYMNFHSQKVFHIYTK